MGAVATFDPNAFGVRYPEFAQVAPALLSAYAAETALYLANDGTGPVNDPNLQLALINMLVAHLCQLNATVTAPNGAVTPASPLVGRISSASEGSVSVSTDAGALPGSAAWFSQTKYGLSAWQAMAPYRTMQYIPGGAVRCGIPAGLPWSGWAALGYYG